MGAGIHLARAMDKFFDDQTICAIATPLGEGGIGIVKISGPQARAIALRLFRSRSERIELKSHRLVYGTVIDPATGETVDEVLLSYMAAPRTYTAQDVVEINCHSGFLVLDRILELVLAAGARLAEPGEFTRRAFLAGRIDLSQAEAVLDILHARSERSLALANRQLQGELRELVESWQDLLVDIQAQTEACIDFSEDLDDEPAPFKALPQQLRERLVSPIQGVLARFRQAKVVREGLKLVLVGKPNVGKSSLLNALIGRDRAIVTPFPGTTRDVVEDSFLVSGVLVRVLDTAGLRTRPEPLEALGIERTLRALDEADVALWLMDRSRPLVEEDAQVFQAVARMPFVILLNKADLPSAVDIAAVRHRYDSAVSVRQLCALDPADVEELKGFLADRFLRQPLEACRSALVSNVRHRQCLAEALAALERAAVLAENGDYAEVISIELETARRQLDCLSGRQIESDLLDRIFSQFCIGK